MVWVIITLSVLILVLGYTTYNLLRKNEALETSLEEFENGLNQQEELISEIATKIDSSMLRMKEIDRIGSFEADDETGIIFKNIYEIISELEEYYGTETQSEE
jgi:hypothetical protein